MKKFTEQDGVEVRVDNEGWEDVRPKAAVAANVGSGPDIIVGSFDDAHQYPDKLVDVTDVANYLGGKYGGWYDVCREYGTKTTSGSRSAGHRRQRIVYRESHVKAAGFDAFPKDTAGFLKLMQALKAKGTPPGFALGKAIGDGNNWAHWLLWSHGGKMVDEKNNVVINSPETVASLEYAKQLYETFVPGTLSWLDPSNNKAFLDGQVSLTGNGISSTTRRRTRRTRRSRRWSPTSTMPTPHRPGRQAHRAELFSPDDPLQVLEVPERGQGVPRFMMEGEQYNPWIRRPSATRASRSRRTSRTRSGPSTRSTPCTATG